MGLIASNCGPVRIKVFSSQAKGTDAVGDVPAGMLDLHDSTRGYELSVRRSHLASSAGRIPKSPIHRNLVHNRVVKEIQPSRLGVEWVQGCQIDLAIAGRERDQDSCKWGMRKELAERAKQIPAGAEKFLAEWKLGVEFRGHSDRTIDISSPRGASQSSRRPFRRIIRLRPAEF